LWRDDLTGWERLRFIINCCTRLRYVDRKGRLSLRAKGPIGSQPKGCIPWFQHPQRQSRDQRIVFGHWSTLGLYFQDNVICLDTGCVWGKYLTAARIDGAAQGVVTSQLPCRQVANSKLKS
jgi:bis(5'-nucleosyl)-tetraphosphatase (symmetrical)